MKKILVLLSLLLSISSFANNAQVSEVKQALNTYINAMKDKDVSKMINSLYEPVFKLISKEQLTTSFEQMYQSNKTPEMKNIIVKKIEDIQQYKNGYFTQIDYIAELELVPPSEDKEKIELFLEIFKATLPKNSTAIYNEKTSKIEINQNSKILAIDENNKGWSFVAESFIEDMKQSNLIPTKMINTIYQTDKEQ
ncbi:hypothetical protein [Halarcobacter sp.]|uniref:hypothetical protein n=1 Tax=Halarcobacter sp. TaxID=2321133 RepID=UPI0029F4E2D9|nr:hypothetical protein [Halarcobacter sp.]